ncbi:MAG: PAS domain S-box protein [Brevundimonas sp.]|nr:PAS domain S-box protein [Brevundimonas sp.]
MGADAFFRSIALARPAGVWRTLVVIVGCALGGLALRVALTPVFGGFPAHVVMLPPVVLAAIWVGRRGGLAVTLLCLIGSMTIAATTTGPALFDRDAALVGATAYVAVAVLMTLIAASLRNSLRLAEDRLSELMASEGRIDESETRFRDISDAAPVMLWTADAKGRVYLNAAFRRFWGDRPFNVLNLKPWLDAIHPEDRDRVFKASLNALKTRTPLFIEGRYRRHDGEWRILATDAQPRLGPDGAFLGMVGANTDVTDQRHAEAAVRESEERFRLMADTAPSPVWLTNAEGEVEFVNKALEAFYGQAAEHILGHVWKQAIHPDDIEDVARAQAPRAQRLPYGFECRFMRADGAWRWMRVSVNPRFDGDGAFLGYVGLSFDVTEAREALERLERQQRRQGFLLRLSDELRGLAEPDDIMGHVSRALAQKLDVDRVGFGEAQADGETVSVRNAWARDGLDTLSGSWRLSDHGEAQARDLKDGIAIRTRDIRQDDGRHSGQVFESQSVRARLSVPLMRGGSLKALLFAHATQARDWPDDDVTLLQDVAARTWAELERARAEAEVRESEQRFRAIADTAPVLIWVTHPDRTRAFVNQAYVAYYGGSYDDALAADWRAVVHPEDQARILTESVSGEATGRPFSMEARYLRHDGSYRWLRSFSRPRIGPDGAVAGFVGVAFDVTDPKKAEQDLKRINELLEDRVGEALAEKAKAEADLMHAQRMEAVGRLTGGVAHDFNNLLTVVIGALDIILRSPNDAAKRQKLGEAALAAARRGERLTHQLLAFSRRQALRPEAVDLNALIRESEPLLRRAVGEAVDMKLKLRRGGARVNVDPAQFEAALLNLVVNARDALGDKGRVVIQTQSCDVDEGDVTGLAPGTYVCVAVTDNGVGMAHDVIDRVFEPFFTTKPVGKGTGLGLSQVHGFAHQSGGGAAITSTLGQGTEIRLYLPPLADDAVKAEIAVVAAPRGSVAGKRLLLVEDDAGVAAVAVELLEAMGMQVTTAETAPHALAVLAEAKFDVMLSDIVMPGGMTGIELARHCAVTWPAMQIVLASGYAGDDVDEALADAPWLFLRKPYSAEALKAIIHEAVG